MFRLGAICWRFSWMSTRGSFRRASRAFLPSSTVWRATRMLSFRATHSVGGIPCSHVFRSGLCRRLVGVSITG